MQISDKLIPQRVKVALVSFLYLLVVYSLLRLIFYFIQSDYYVESGVTEILFAFYKGLRFDIAAVIMLNLPVLVLYFLPLKLYKIKYSGHILFVLFVTLNLIGIILNFVDYAYYPTVQRRLLFEPYTALPDLLRMLPGLFDNYSFLIFLSLAGCILFVYGFLLLMKKLNRVYEIKYSWWKSTIVFVLVVILSVIGIRGGLQLKPIRQTNAFFSDNIALGYLALNSSYTVLRSYFQYTFQTYNFMSSEESNRIIETMLKSENEEMLNEEYPFLRKKKPDQPMIKKNIVLFILESWSANVISSIAGEKTYTPNFDSLAKEGMLFTNFLASGQRSITSVTSILTSIPSIFQGSIIGSRVEVNKMRGLGSIMLEHGYTTSFHYGATYGSMGFDGFVPRVGLSQYFSKEDCENYADSLDDGVWGMFDEPYFLDAAKRINGFDEPFCSVIFSLTSHDPCRIPENKKKLFEKYNDDTPFLTALRYSDYALGKFFEYAKEQPWFDDTIFILTADHTTYTTRNDLYSVFHVPLLIYAPSFIESQVIDKTGSHVDILPTVLDLLNIETTHSSMGRSLLDGSLEGFAVNAAFPKFFYFEKNGIYIDDLENRREYFPLINNSMTKENHFEENKAHADSIQHKLKAYIQGASNAVNKDLIYPAL